jgi:diguanylate cyclase (GGDEF)-like protein
MQAREHDAAGSGGQPGIGAGGAALRRLLTLAEGTSDIVGVVEADGTPSYLNRAGRELMGLPAEGPIDDVHPSRVYSEASWAVLETVAVPTAARLGIWRGELEVRPLDGGEPVPVWQVMICERDADGRIEFFGSISRDVRERRALEDRLRHQAEHDLLTGLPNRVPLLARLEQALADADEHRLVAVLFFDLDRFKVVNDSLGHQAGDRLLAEVARRVQRAVRDGDLAGRFGGDEFVVVCADVASIDEALSLAQRVRDGVGGRFDLYGDELPLSVSVGVAVSDGEATPDEVLRDADAALYEAKARGRDAVALFDAELRRRAVDRLDVEQSLRRALEFDELRIAYQPLVELATGRVVALEALVRWSHPERGELLPADFLGVAEETGLILPIGAWVLDQACADAGGWPAIEPGGDPPALFVNVSPRELLGGGLVERVQQAMARHALRPRQLHLEITEQALMVDVAQAEAVIQRIRALGTRFALDDFGTGHSSLAHLRHFPIGVVKIDRSFVQSLDDPITAAITEAVIGLAHQVDTQTVAEGIEDDRQLRRLRTMGCQWGQGRHLVPPLSAEEVAEHLAAGDWRLELPGP